MPFFYGVMKMRPIYLKIKRHFYISQLFYSWLFVKLLRYSFGVIPSFFLNTWLK